MLMGVCKDGIDSVPISVLCTLVMKRSPARGHVAPSARRTLSARASQARLVTGEWHARRASRELLVCRRGVEAQRAAGHAGVTPYRLR